MKKLTITVTFLLALAPAVAFARSKGATAHVRPNLFHDRSPKPHVHESHAHHA